METTVQLETWVNTTKSTVVTVKTDHLGQQTRVATKGGQKLAITPEDRRFNQEMIKSGGGEKYDPFQNGLLAPVKLVDKADAEKAAQNPNQMTEDDLQKVLSAPAAEFAERLMAISSEPVLRRLRKVARDADVKPSRQEAIQSRLETVAPNTKIDSGKVESDTVKKPIRNN